MHMPKMALGISIDNHYTSKIYTCNSRVSGTLSVCTQRDTPFNCVQIALLGTSHTRIDMLPAPKIIDNDFLRLDMPIREKSYSSGRTFRAGQTYHIPFEFTIPRALSSHACHVHTLSGSGHIQDLHMRLPPTMGDWEKDDMSPVMARVEYTIVARVLQQRASETGHATEISQPIKVVPSFPEDPPLSITEQDTRYCLKKTKQTRKSLLSTQKDQITATVAQPAPAVLTMSGQQLSPTSATIHLTFKPDSTFASPPDISLAQIKLETISWFSGAPIKTLPELGEARDSSGVKQELKYITSTKLPTTGVEATWHKGDAGGQSSSWEGSLQIPIALPTTHKMFLPTFYSCFVARTYVLHLSVNAAASGTKINLSVPLQISVQEQGGKDLEVSGDELPTFEAAIAWRSVR
ncbi:arrestin domain-containing protein [Colletotrichum kahawae]|uniref:Arrestin domain-containing protein n=1 Tax=Colletotrichum kahawae TaxID=34407 RepID=A0AAE0D569_COLKA|nr:arrestin domain-containing protein [Colletotrichum kahawae]